MAAKRSRLARSSSSGDISVISGLVYDSPESHCQTLPENNPTPIKMNSSPAPVNFPRNPPDYSRPSIFEIGFTNLDPVDRKWNELSKSGKFLEKCFYCKTKLCKDKDVFLYSNLRAFCSDECRTKQIEMDEDLERMDVSPMVNSARHR